MSNEIQRDSRRFSHNQSAAFLIAFADACGALKTGELIKSAAAKMRIPAKTETQNLWQRLGLRGANGGWCRQLSGCSIARGLDEGKQVRVHRIGVGGAHAVREVLVDLESRLVQELYSQQGMVGDRHNQVV